VQTSPLQDSLLTAFQGGQERALARVLTLLEGGHQDSKGQELLQAVRQLGKRSRVVGITGPPGAGKSTLSDALIASYRARGETVAVLAVDPSSPFSGGAILGDRIRMLRHTHDSGVFVRSVATRGALGGLAQSVSAMLSALEGFGFDHILLETVGVGQSEVDIAQVADTVLLVLTPAGGDGIQAFKAGILEIADLLVVNKADLPEADRFSRALSGALELGEHGFDSWMPPVLQTIAPSATGISELVLALERHQTYLRENNTATGLEARRLKRARFEVRSSLLHWAEQLTGAAGNAVFSRVAQGQTSPLEVARTLLEELNRSSSS
jgi:LAO/AO transport system kinase